MKDKKITEISQIKLKTAQTAGLTKALGFSVNCLIPTWNLPSNSSRFKLEIYGVPPFSEEQYNFYCPIQQGFGRCGLNADIVNDG